MREWLSLDPGSFTFTLWYIYALRMSISLFESILKDIRAAKDKDPAASSTLEILLTYPGFHARELHRLAHALHQDVERDRLVHAWD